MRRFRHWLLHQQGWPRRQQKWLLPALVGAIGGLIFVSLFSPFSYSIHAFRVTLSVEIMDHGSTRLIVPPVGEVSARTHGGPLALTIALDNVDIDLLRDLAAAGTLGEQPLQDVVAGLKGVLRHFLLRTVILAGLGGGLAAVMVGQRRPRFIVGAVLSALVVCGGLMAITDMTYDQRAFSQPKFTGVLRAAPWMVGLVEESILKVAELGAGLATLANNLVVLFDRIDALEPLARPPAELTALVVSDIHNNPAAIDFVAEIVNSFEPDLILDGGDLTDFGTAFEAPLIGGIADLGIPYVMVPGNHESPDIVAHLAQLENGHVLTAGEINVLGLRILGISDPSSTTTSPRLPTGVEIRERIQRLRAILADQKEPPDILLVHNPLVAEPFIGAIPLVITGHTHTIWLRERSGTVWLNPGSTGAAGIRGLQAKQEVPYSLILAYLKRRPQGDGWYITAADTLRVFNFETGFHLERRLFGPAA